jgi:Ca2+-binding EF-hand superfamily protein
MPGICSYNKRYRLNNMNRVYVILASLILVATPLAGCLDEATLEELLDDVIGCMDENAKNFDDNATTELVGECIYAASMQVFVDSMTQQMTIEGLLNQSTSAGYSMSITMPMDGEDMGLEETIIMNVQETVKVNLSSNSAYVSMHIGIPLMLTSVTTIIQVGEVVNVHNELSGMMVTQMGAETVDDSYQTRDASPNVMEWVLPMLADSMAEDMMDDEGEDDMMDDLDMMNATMSFTLDPVTNSQTMHLSSTNETGDTLNLTILIDESQNLMSYSMVQSNATSEMHMSYAVMWGDAISITVDETLPRTAIPVHWDGLSMSGGDDNGDDDEDDMFLCDSGEEIPEDWVNDGEQDCYDGSDEFDDDNEPDMFLCDSGEEIPEDWVNDGDEDCSDGSDEFDDDEAPSPEDVLDMYDTNMDDYLSFEEFWDAFGDEENSENYDSFHDIFNNSDYDMNELLDINELESFIADISDSNNNGEMSMEDYFHHFDDNGDGNVTASEWIDMNNMSDEDLDGVSDMIDMYDDDSSGGLDYYEFELLYNEMFTNDGDDDEDDMFLCDSGEEIPEDYVNDGDEDCSDGSDEFDDNDGGDSDEEPRSLSLTVAANQTFEAPLNDFAIQFLLCNSDERSECMIEGEASLNSLTGAIGDSSYVYGDLDMDGMISAGDTLEITDMDPNYEFDLYDSWSDSYVSESVVNGPNMPGFGGLLATISMLGAAFLLPRRDD